MNTVEGMLFGRYRPEELNDIFTFLSAEEMGVFFPYLELREWQSGQVVLNSGDPGDFMGFLIEGKLAVKMEAIFPGRFILVAVLERGSLVGELSVVEGWRRHATIVAMEKCSVLILSRENMALMLAQAPALGLKFYRRIIYVLGHRLREASERLARLL